MIFLLRSLIWLMSLLPFFWVFIFYSYVFRVTREIGRLPKYDNPQSGMFHNHFIFTSESLDYIAYTYPIYFLLLISIEVRKVNINYKTPFSIWLIGNFIIFVMFIIDPFGLFEWFAD